MTRKHMLLLVFTVVLVASATSAAGGVAQIGASIGSLAWTETDKYILADGIADLISEMSRDPSFRGVPTSTVTSIIDAGTAASVYDMLRQIEAAIRLYQSSGVSYNTPDVGWGGGGFNNPSWPNMNSPTFHQDAQQWLNENSTNFEWARSKNEMNRQIYEMKREQMWIEFNKTPVLPSEREMEARFHAFRNEVLSSMAEREAEWNAAWMQVLSSVQQHFTD